MKRWLIGTVIVAAVGLVATRAYTARAYEYAFPPTGAGEMEVKVVPASTLIRSSGEEEGHYYKNKPDGMFMDLFRYIADRDIAMTVPVEADIKPATMAFYIGKDAAGKPLENTDDVVVEKLPERQVLAVGIRGSYSQENFDDALAKGSEWLNEQSEYRQAGEPRMVFWDGPMTLPVLRRSELHLPVEKVAAETQAE